MSTGPGCPLCRFLAETAGDHFPAIAGRWSKEEFPSRSVYEIIQWEMREASENLVMLNQKPMQKLQPVSCCVKPHFVLWRLGQRGPKPLPGRMAGEHRDLIWKGMGAPRLSGPWRPAECGGPACSGQPFQLLSGALKRTALSASVASSKNQIFLKHLCCGNSASIGLVKYVQKDWPLSLGGKNAWSVDTDTPHFSLFQY